MKRTIFTLAAMALILGASVTPTMANAMNNTVQIEDSKNDVDRMLDQYEDFVNKSISLLKKAEAGDMTAMKEYAELTKKAQALQKQLERYKGNMTPAQLARLQKIVMKLASAI